MRRERDHSRCGLLAHSSWLSPLDGMRCFACCSIGESSSRVARSVGVGVGSNLFGLLGSAAGSRDGLSPLRCVSGAQSETAIAYPRRRRVVAWGQLSLSLGAWWIRGSPVVDCREDSYFLLVTCSANHNYTSYIS